MSRLIERGLKRLLDLIINRRISRLVLTHKDRLLRFGAELVFTLCEARQVEVEMLYDSRSHKNRKLVEAARILAE